jgi:hypothetical protein
MPETPETTEAGAVRRLIHAGVKNEDPLTVSAGVIRASRLATKLKTDITNPDIAKALGLDKLPPVEED